MKLLFKKPLLLTSILLIWSIVLLSCTNGATSKGEQKNGAVKDTTKAPKGNAPAFVENEYDRAARFIAGVPQTEDNPWRKLEQSDIWKTYVAEYSKAWQALDSSRMLKIRGFQKTELSGNKKISDTLFYPFSGADFLYGYAFFPNQKYTVMFGLEPCGTMPTFAKSFQKDNGAVYMQKVRTAINSVTQFSFFITKEMSHQLTDHQLDGVSPILALFMARYGCSIDNYEKVYVDCNGKLATMASTMKLDTCASQGVRFTYRTKEDPNTLRTLVYFWINSDNRGLARRQGFVNMMNTMPPFTTFVKSASYLMHDRTFSTMRDIILKKSNVVVQDESGIPFKYFYPNKGWKEQMYGMYTKPIALFNYRVQPDLAKYYADPVTSKNVKRLGFGVGYPYKDGNSVFMIFNKN